ncbi:zinc metallopeptidase [Limisphaera sp. VF-2]|mgnify:CR=1 FL=1|jgi:Zn-dependent membrane protease YugP|uniref:zinc metallopeptidase n=1 Tax=Limisphaera sp. VF-2 TaxID=3400418 RepID=UPI00176BDDA5|nr:zinc metallopeptidase [Limisphaera sp.]
MFWLIFLVTLVLSLWATARVKATYHRYSRMLVSSGLTGAEAAAAILRRAGITDVEIVAHNGFLGDHYDPIHKRLVLCEENFYGQSPAALGVAAHEAGHALQHAQAYKPLQLRMAAVGITTYASQVVTFLPLLFMFGGVIEPMVGLMLMALAWGVIMAFNLITLPVEFDASRRARALLTTSGMIRTEEEAEAVRRVLNAAAWTYVAAFVTSLLYFLYYVLPLLTGGRSRD